jgi:hypothetical protein
LKEIDFEIIEEKVHQHEPLAWQKYSLHDVWLEGVYNPEKFTEALL